MPSRIYERERDRAEKMAKNEPARADYWLGYRRGIGRAFYGERFATDREHSVWLAYADAVAEFHVERARGYRDGLEFKHVNGRDRAAMLAHLTIQAARRPRASSHL